MNFEPGIYSIPASQYHADPAPTPSLSNSIANILLDQSPIHAMLAHPRLNADYKREDSSRFDLGSAAHAMLLERDESKIVRVQADSWRTNVAKAARADAQANGKYAVLEHQYGAIEEMVRVAHEYVATTELGDILSSGTAEQTILWRENGLWCRARPDMLSSDGAIILDYKSTASAAPEFIARQIGRMGYDLQAEFYTRGYSAVRPDSKVTFVFLFQEITPPYACSLMALSNAYREVGKLKCARALQLWERCLTSNVWPGYTSKILYVEPKPWDLIQAEEVIAAEESEYE